MATKKSNSITGLDAATLEKLERLTPEQIQNIVNNQRRKATIALNKRAKAFLDEYPFLVDRFREAYSMVLDVPVHMELYIYQFGEKSSQVEVESLDLREIEKQIENSKVYKNTLADKTKLILELEKDIDILVARFEEPWEQKPYSREAFSANVYDEISDRAAKLDRIKKQQAKKALKEKA